MRNYLKAVDDYNRVIEFYSFDDFDHRETAKVVERAARVLDREGRPTRIVLAYEAPGHPIIGALPFTFDSGSALSSDQVRARAREEYMARRNRGSGKSRRKEARADLLGHSRAYTIDTADTEPPPDTERSPIQRDRSEAAESAGAARGLTAALSSFEGGESLTERLVSLVGE